MFLQIKKMLKLNYLLKTFNRIYGLYISGFYIRFSCLTYLVQIYTLGLVMLENYYIPSNIDK